MTSITLDLLSGKDRQVIPFSVPILTRADYDQRLSDFAKKVRSEKYLLFKRYNIVCRELFQERGKEGFCFPSTKGSHTSLTTSLPNRLFFLKGVLRWNFILVFEPQDGSRDVIFSKTSLKFTQENGYPAGANNADFFPFSASCISLLVSENGFITNDSNGRLSLQGIAVSLLQTSFNQGKSLFIQRKEIIISPHSPLREGHLGNINLSRFIKIDCFCRNKSFSYSTYLPVLTSQELEEKLTSNATNRLAKYGEASLRYEYPSITRLLPALNETISSYLIFFPPGMEVDVPFGSARIGELFFSYSGQLQSSFQLVFFPPLFEEDQILPRLNHRCGNNWHIESANPSKIFCIGSKVSVYCFPNVSLVSCSSCEYKIVGMKIEIVSTSQGGYWGIFCSTEKETASSAGSLVPGTSGVRPHSNEPRKKVARLFSSPQPVITVSVPSERQGQQAQQEGRIRPVSGRPAVMDCPDRWIFPLPPQATSTVSVPLKRQNSPIGPWDKRGVVPGSSGVREHPHAQGGPEQQAQQGGKNRPCVIFFPPLESVIIDSFALEASQQGVGATPRASVIVSQGVERSPRASVIVSQGVEPSPRESVIVSVGSVQQKPLWKPYE